MIQLRAIESVQEKPYTMVRVRYISNGVTYEARGWALWDGTLEWSTVRGLQIATKRARRKIEKRLRWEVGLEREVMCLREALTTRREEVVAANATLVNLHSSTATAARSSCEEGVMTTPISNAAKMIRTLKNQVDEYHMLYAQALAQRDTLQVRVEAADGLAEAMQAEQNCEWYWADGYVPSDEDDLDGEERYNLIYGRYCGLVRVAKKQALAAYRAASE